MSWVLLTTALVLLAYAALMLVYAYGWRQQAHFLLEPGVAPRTFLSIIIPARNEASHIEACVRGVLANQYPRHLMEIIVVDDHSEDETLAIVRGIQDDRVKTFSLRDHMNGEPTKAFKKKALALGISQSVGELIVTTDADCIPGREWLLHLAAIYEQQHPVLIIAPVDFISNSLISSVFQSLDFMTMQGITGAVHYLSLGNMSNGANLAFARFAYEAVNGYSGIDHLATGDDYLLMSKLHQQFGGRIAYLKSRKAIMRTMPQPDWVSFFQQRVRWASKSGKYKDDKLTASLILVYVTNVLLFAATIGSIILGTDFHLLATLGLFAFKISVELTLLAPVSRFFGKERQLWYFPFLQPLHVTYIVVTGFFGFFGSYQWKGRQVR